MRLLLIASLLTATMPIASAAPTPSVVFTGRCAFNSRIGQGNVFQDQWMLSHQLARPFRCDHVSIADGKADTVWITFYSKTEKEPHPRMVFIGSPTSSSQTEFDVIGGQALYGIPGPDNRYAWPGQVTCSIQMRSHDIATAQRITCTAIVQRGSEEKIMAAIFNRAGAPRADTMADCINNFMRANPGADREFATQTCKQLRDDK